MKHLTYRIALIFAIMGLSCANAFAQQVKGTVKDAFGEPVIGAAVIVEGTSIGTTADFDGNFAIAQAVPSDAVLVVSSIGYKTARVPVTGSLDIILEEDTEMLDDVVVVGYGVQKKSVVTAAISSITSDDLKKTAHTRVDNLLQGMTSGVTVTSTSGAPDAGSQIRIRGIGTINDSNPLYIVDGMPVGGIDYLNPNDIERIEVLKDAASGAVYGARAANGVVLVTTRQGSKGKTTVTYDYSHGWQNPWRKPQVLNATEYAIMMNEGYLNNGQAPIYDDPYSFGQGTDWVSEIFNNNAPVVKHDININGGNDRVQYSTSAGFLTREGTIGGDFGRANYDRFTLRQALNSVLFDNSDERNWLNKMTMQSSVSYSHINSTGISTNSEFGSPLGSAMGMSPLESIFADEATVAQYKATLTPAQFDALLRDSQGRYYTVVDGVKYNEQNNPLAMLEQPGEKYWTDKFVANGNVELQIWDGLKFRSQIGIDMAFWGSHGYSEPYYLSTKNYNLESTSDTITYDKDGNEVITTKTNYATGAWQSMNRSLTWQVENILTYDKTFGAHSVSAILGQSALSSSSSNVGASAKGLMYPYDEYKISVNNTIGQAINGDRDGWGSWNSIPYRLASYFGRVSYNYDERYMAEVTLRRDASSRFGDNNKWGTFPSFSLGWNIKNESFMLDYNWLSILKLRASWGVNGNDSIGNFRYAVYMSSGNNYAFGSGANGSEVVNVGAKPSGLANPNVRWEESRQTDIGIDAGFLGNKITATVDWYRKNTAGMLLSMPVPSYAGDSSPIGNLGDMVNSGVELEVSYRDGIGDFNWHVSANATYNKNTLTYLGDDSTDLYGSSHKIGQLTRGEIGMPFPFFYGYVTDGVFQNPDEVAAYVNADGAMIQPNATPGDFRFKDVNGDGALTDADRTYIGKGIPDWTFGLNLGFEWKGLDFNMLLQGQAGVQAFNVTRRTDLYYINLPKTILNRWTGEGTTNSAPKFEFTSANENYRVSDYWVEDASFLRARNVQLGYTVPANITKKAFIQRLRVYAQAENLFTLTKYSGCDPEVTGGNGFGTELGIDRGVYPQNRTFSVGVNLTF